MDMPVYLLRRTSNSLRSRSRLVIPILHNMMLSYNGTTFKAASKMLRDILKHPEIVASNAMDLQSRESSMVGRNL